MIDLLARLAWRNLWRRPRRTAIILFAVVLGVWTMLTFAAFMRGMVEQQVHDAIHNLSGHVQLHAPGYLDDPVVQHSMDAPAPALLALLQAPPVRAWAARVRVPAVVASEREAAGVTLVGIDPAQERGLSFIGEGVSQGRALHDRADPGIVLGRKLAERLETRLGKRVVLMSQDEDNQLAERGFRVVGIYTTAVEDTETLFAFIGLDSAQTLLRLGTRVSELSLLSADRDALGPLLQRLRAATPGLDAQDWRALNPLATVMLEVINGFLLVWYLVAFLAMGFGLVNTLLMAVFERSREVGLLQALGMRPGWIQGQILLEALFLLILGLALGNLAAWLTLLAAADGLDFSRYAEGYQLAKLNSLVYPLVRSGDVISANLLVLGLGLLASYYPAWHATRQVPTQAMNRI